MMNYDVFLEVVKERILDYLPEMYQKGEVMINKVQKVNETLDALSVLIGEKSHISPNLYLEDIYQRYRETDNLDETLKEAATLYVEIAERATVDERDLKLDTLKDNIICTLVNTEQNKELLEHVPHKPFQDLSIIFRWVVSVGEKQMSSAVVNESLMDQIGMNIDELMEVAMENTKRIMPISICSMEETLMGLASNELEMEFIRSMVEAERAPKETMWIISNSMGMNGASAILYEDKLHELAEKLETDLYLLPSSLHECIAVSVDMGTPEELAEMVQSVNMNEVELKDRLSNNVYHYDKDLRELTMATDVPNKRLDGIVAEKEIHYDYKASR